MLQESTVTHLFCWEEHMLIWFGVSLRRHVRLSGRGRSQPASTPGIHDGPPRVSFSLDCAELEPVNQSKETLVSCSASIYSRQTLTNWL